MAEPCDYSFVLVVIGDLGVGRRSVIVCFTEGTFRYHNPHLPLCENLILTEKDVVIFSTLVFCGHRLQDLNGRVRREEDQARDEVSDGYFGG